MAFTTKRSLNDTLREGARHSRAWRRICHRCGLPIQGTAWMKIAVAGIPGLGDKPGKATVCERCAMMPGTIILEYGDALDDPRAALAPTGAGAAPDHE